MIRLLYALRGAGLLLLLMQTAIAHAGTAVIQVDFLPLDEAASVVRSQLSAEGRVAALASRRVLIVDDDAAHISKVKSLLKRLDVYEKQYTVRLTLKDRRQQTNGRVSVSGRADVGRLSGGWVRLGLQQSQGDSMSSQQFSLRVSAGQPASMEIGTIEPVNQSRTWLSAYGVVRADSVELVPITSGFSVSARPAGSGRVHVRITPWMQHANASIQGQSEMLLGLGTARTPTLPPGQTANLRLNGSPVMQQGRRIAIAGAATELTLKIGREVTIAAVNGEAKKLGSALLSRYSTVGERQMIMRLRVD